MDGRRPRSAPILALCSTTSYSTLQSTQAHQPAFLPRRTPLGDHEGTPGRVSAEQKCQCTMFRLHVGMVPLVGLSTLVPSQRMSETPPLPFLSVSRRTNIGRWSGSSVLVCRRDVCFGQRRRRRTIPSSPSPRTCRRPSLDVPRPRPTATLPPFRNALVTILPAAPLARSAFSFAASPTESPRPASAPFSPAA